MIIEGLFLSVLHKNGSRWYKLEVPCPDAFDEYLQLTFLCRIDKIINYLAITTLIRLLLLLETLIKIVSSFCIKVFIAIYFCMVESL